MEPATQHVLGCVRLAAERGARTVCGNIQVVRDAGKAGVEKFEDACLRNKTIIDPESWAFRVGQRLALEIGRKATRGRRDDLREVRSDGSDEDAGTSGSATEVLLALLEAAMDDPRLTTKQRSALSRLDPHASIRANARRVGMSPRDLRRMLGVAGRRLSEPGKHGRGAS